MSDKGNAMKRDIAAIAQAGGAGLVTGLTVGIALLPVLIISNLLARL